jgi:hypothetical protein
MVKRKFLNTISILSKIYFFLILGFIRAQNSNTSQTNITDWSIEELLYKIDNAFAPITSDFENYYQNSCTDERIPSLFNFTSAETMYKRACVSLIYDWAQIYSNYTCNDWMCNNKGKCNFIINELGYVTPSCSCNSGYTGKNCMFSTANYEIIKSWLKVLDTWTTSKPFDYLNNASVAKYLIKIYGSLFTIITNANFQDLELFTRTQLNVGSSIFKTYILTKNPDLNQEMIYFMNKVFGTIYTGIYGLQPLYMLAAYNGTNENGPKFGIVREIIYPGSEIKMSPANGVNKLRILTERSLQTSLFTNFPMKIDGAFINYESPSLFVPAESITKLAEKAKSIAMIYVRDPKPFYQSHSLAANPAIMSQVVEVVGYDGNQTYIYNYFDEQYPLKLSIPWADVPFKNNDYLKNCKVYKFESKSWFPTECKLLADTNDRRASLSCRTMGTFGVACLGSRVDSTLSSQYFAIPSILISLLALLLD